MGSAMNAAPANATRRPRTAARGVAAATAATAPATTRTARATRTGVTVGYRPPSVGGRDVGVGRGLDDAQRADRPVAQEGAPDHARDRHEAEDPRVGRLLAMVAQQEQVVGRDDPLLLVGGLGGLVDPGFVLERVRLGELHAVHV